MKNLSLTFGNEFNWLLAFAFSLEKEFENFTYEFLDNNEFENLLRNDQKEANSVYWKEIILRAHLASSLAILRTNKWMNAIDQSIAIPNFYSFCANLRGLLENCGDIFDSLGIIPKFLGMHYSKIQNSILKSGELELVIAEEIENHLIHFTYGREIRKDSNSPQSHKAKRNSQYLDKLKELNPKTLEMYGKLCEITHPAADSVFHFLYSTNPRNLIIRRKSDLEIINNFIEEFSGVIKNIPYFSYNPSIMTLKISNLIPVGIKKISILNEIDLSPIPAWNKIKNNLY